MQKDIMILIAALAAMLTVLPPAFADVEQVEPPSVPVRVFRAARNTRGNTNVVRSQPIDHASWIWAPSAAVPSAENGVFLRFRRKFSSGGERIRFDVSADERFHLALDGRFVARGPNRGTVENWQYQTYEVELAEGEHLFEATVWCVGERAPLAQLSYRGGFVFCAEGRLGAQLTTGKAEWEVGVLGGMRPMGAGNGVWGTGDEWEVTGTGPFDAQPAAWLKAEVVRGPAGGWAENWGGRTDGWMLFPSQIPDQTANAVRPGAFKAVTSEAGFRREHVYGEAETAAAEVAGLNALLKSGRPFVIPPHTRLQAAWDLGNYFCGYPELTLAGGRGAKVAWCWTESTRYPDTKLKGGAAGDRDRIVGKCLDGYGDTFVSDGRARARFSTPWFRCGKWCRLDVETQDEPLTLSDLRIVESRYPLELESSFETSADPTLRDVRRIGARAMQMCCHEMLFDCPYYEQQMYPGDTRVQLNVLSAMTRDDRIVRRAIEMYDLATRDDGMCPFRWPTRRTQEGATYTLCYLLMHGDYAMNRADRAWLEARLPGFRRSISAFDLYANAEGLLENLPGWQFMDWVVGWRRDGTAPGGRVGEGVNAEANLLWSLALRSAATVERALGNELVAQHWEERRQRLNRAIVSKFWCEARGILADTPEMKDFSEHAQALALLGDVLPEDKAKACFAHLIADGDLRRTTVYFSYYLFECYFKFGRGDLFLRRLDLWRDYVKKGLATTQEEPDSGEKGQKESRSDCHAWGAHPIWFMQTGLAGIRSDAPFFARVRIAPCPGGLPDLKARHPHPQGWVEVDLKFRDGRATGVVRTPVPGTFAYGSQEVALAAGETVIN